MSLRTAVDVQRFIQACVRYANEAGDGRKFRVEFHDEDKDCRRYIQQGMEPAKAKRLAKNAQFYTYVESNNTYVIHVPRPDMRMSPDEAAIIKGGTLHETTHHTEDTYAGSYIKDGLGNLRPDDKLFQIFNMVEDHRIERKDCEKFEGDAQVFRDMYRIIANKMHDKVRNGEVDVSKFSEDGKKLFGLQTTDLIARESWMQLGDVVNDRIKTLPEETTEVAEKLIENGFDDAIRGTETVEDSINVAKRIFTELFDEDVEKHIEENQQPEGSPQSGQQGDESEEGKGDSSQKGSESDQDGEEEKEGVIPPEEYDYLNMLERSKSPMSRDDATLPNQNQHVDYNSYFDQGREGRYRTVPLDKMGVANFGANYFHPTESGYNTERLTSRGSRLGPHKRIIQSVFDDNDVSANSLANKIRRQLQVISQARWIPGATEGRVQKSRAYRAALPTMGDGHWNKEIFKRRHKNETLDSAVTILCDFSGSMSGDKVAHATFGGYILADSIGRVLGIPTQVTTFSDAEMHESVICVLKNWNERVSRNEYIERAVRATGTMGNNDDASCIMWAYDDLLRRREKRRIIIVLSDGSPSSPAKGDCMASTKKIVKDIEGDPSVEIYAIGIQDRNVKHIYKEHQVINEPSQIENAILETVKRKLIV